MILEQATRAPKLEFKFTDGAEPVGRVGSGCPFGFLGGLGWEWNVRGKFN